MKYDSDSTVIEPEVIPPRSDQGPKAAETTGPWGVNPILAGFLLDVANLFLASIPGFIAGVAIGIWACVYNRIPAALTLLIAFSCGAYVFTPPMGRAVPLATLIGVIIVFWRKWGTKNG